MAAIDTSFGGIVLCGGKSSRMGRPKMSLPLGPELMLERVVRILSEVVSPIVVVAAAGQEVPQLPADVMLARDEQEGLGPLAGLAVGLSALRPLAEAAYVSSCDVPLLKPAFVRHLIGLLESHDLVMPRDGKYHHPLAGVYRTELADRVGAMVAAGRLRPVFLIDECGAREVDVEELRGVDPRLDSLRNVNTPEDYEQVCRSLDLEADEG